MINGKYRVYIFCHILGTITFLSLIIWVVYTSHPNGKTSSQFYPLTLFLISFSPINYSTLLNIDSPRDADKNITRLSHLFIISLWFLFINVTFNISKSNIQFIFFIFFLLQRAWRIYVWKFTPKMRCFDTHIQNLCMKN